MGYCEQYKRAAPPLFASSTTEPPNAKNLFSIAQLWETARALAPIFQAIFQAIDKRKEETRA